MRYGALLVMLVAGLGLAGCGTSKPLTTTSANQAANSTVMLDPPLSVPPGFNAPPLESAAATAQQPADVDQTAPSQPTLGQTTMSQPSLAQTTLSQPTLGQTASGQSTVGETGGGQPTLGQTAGGQSTLGQPSLGPPPLGQSATGQPATGQLATGQLAAVQPALGQPGSAPTLSAKGQTPGEQAFLQAAGASDANPNIRAEIDAANQATMDPALVDKLVFGPATPSANGAGVVIQRAKPGILDTLF
ncbi:MAG TPA: DUF3035 domain-containing protein [Verrucomicrobiae bacterium]|nr:DUF3035 domain-containing protein [Verrucomicrobiae bacterium]